MTVHFILLSFEIQKNGFRTWSGEGERLDRINWHHQISVKLLDLSRSVECGSVHWLLERAAKWQPHMPKVKLKRRHSIHTAAPEGKRNSSICSSLRSGISIEFRWHLVRRYENTYQVCDPAQKSFTCSNRPAPDNFCAAEACTENVQVEHPVFPQYYDSRTDEHLRPV